MLARAAQKPTYTRSIRHGNAMNKRGVADHYQRSGATNAKNEKYHFNKYVENTIPTKFTMHRHYGDLIVKAHSPKPEHVVCSECRFTIPLSPKNSNIFEQEFDRAQDVFDYVLCELKTEFKAHSFATDEEHEIEIVA